MAKTESMVVPLGSPLPNFELFDAHGTLVKSSQFANMPLLVMFLCNHCPFVKHIRLSLADFARMYVPQTLGIVAINANDFAAFPEDSPEKMRELSDALGFVFPYLVDETQAIAKAFAAICTPEFFLYDRNGLLVYHGQYDDSRPGNSIPTSGADLRHAVDAVLANKPVFKEQRPSLGCSIKWRPPKP